MKFIFLLLAVCSLADNVEADWVEVASKKLYEVKTPDAIVQALINESDMLKLLSAFNVTRPSKVVCTWLRSDEITLKWFNDTNCTLPNPDLIKPLIFKEIKTSFYYSDDPNGQYYYVITSPLPVCPDEKMQKVVSERVFKKISKREAQ